MKDKKLEEINASISLLENQKQKRMAELQDPKRATVRSLWNDLNHIIGKLEENGENPTDMNFEDLHINGNMFSRSASGEIIEH